MFECLPGGLEGGNGVVRGRRSGGADDLRRTARVDAFDAAGGVDRLTSDHQRVMARPAGNAPQASASRYAAAFSEREKSEYGSLRKGSNTVLLIAAAARRAYRRTAGAAQTPIGFGDGWRPSSPTDSAAGVVPSIRGVGRSDGGSEAGHRRTRGGRARGVAHAGAPPKSAGSVRSTPISRSFSGSATPPTIPTTSRRGTRLTDLRRALDDTGWCARIGLSVAGSPQHRGHVHGPMDPGRTRGGDPTWRLRVGVGHRSCGGGARALPPVTQGAARSARRGGRSCWRRRSPCPVAASGRWRGLEQRSVAPRWQAPMWSWWPTRWRTSPVSICAAFVPPLASCQSAFSPPRPQRNSARSERRPKRDAAGSGPVVVQVVL